MDQIIAAICGGCAAICTTSCQTFCNTRKSSSAPRCQPLASDPGFTLSSHFAIITGSYGTDTTCADNCCRFNCGWKHGQFPVEDYPIANSQPEDGTAAATNGGAKEGEDTSLPAYTATPQMSTSPPTAAAANGSQPTPHSNAVQTAT